jgi:hypothetical protein
VDSHYLFGNFLQFSDFRLTHFQNAGDFLGLPIDDTGQAVASGSYGVHLLMQFVTVDSGDGAVYFNHRCPDYGRLEKLLNAKYKTVAEKAYGIRHADN